MTESKVDVLTVLDREIAAIKNTKEMVDFAMSADRWVAYADHLFSLNNTRAAVAELIEAAAELRQRQRDYLSGPKSERSEEKGRLVGVAASRVDAALAACTPAKSEGR